MALFRIKRQNINESALNIDKFDATVQNQISVESIQAVYDSVNLAAPAITSVAYANSSYTVLDDAAANVSGGYIVISGSGFQSGAQITIGTDSATSVTHVNSSTVRAQIPAKDAGSYHLTLINPTGGISILVNGITYSNTPVWGTAGTLDNQAVDTAFAVTLSANSDSNVTYSNTTTLPAGTELLSNGYFYGTISGIESETTYNFTVAAIDEELQDNPREFSVTVTVSEPLELYAWGLNTSGQVGMGFVQADTARLSNPVQVAAYGYYAGPEVGPWKDISNGANHSAAIKTDGTLWLWGANYRGQLGQNNISDSSNPIQIGTLNTWNLVSAGFYNTLAIKTDGTLWGWGDNGSELGLNDRIKRSSPVQVGSSNTWNKASIGRYFSLATKTDGTLWSWGLNSIGQLGLDDRIVRSSPTQVGAGTNWNNIKAGHDSAIASKTDGTLWTFGRNGAGQLGLGDTISRSSPTQVGSGTTWNLVSINQYFGMATKTDGTLWSWGDNGDGALGLNDRTYKSIPAQIGSDTTWNYISAGTRAAIASKTDGSLWTWGKNNNGQLGLNNVINRSSPTQVGSSTTWDLVSMGKYTTMAIKIV